MMLFRLSQGQLNLLQTCPRKFQQIYLEKLATPITPEQQEKISWGNQFHLLMQQRELGLPIETLLAEDLDLKQCYEAFIPVAPEIFNPQSHQQVFRESEHRRTLNFQGHLLTVVYDLLILETQQAKIFDWKTYPKPPNQYGLEQNWQTLLYPFVLAETSDYLPEQISMTYWFVQSRTENSNHPQPQKLKFIYSNTQHQKIKTQLTQLLENLRFWTKRYQETGENFPQIPEPAHQCESCQFSFRCQRQAEDVIGKDWMPNLNEIEEIAI